MTPKAVAEKISCAANATGKRRDLAAFVEIYSLAKRWPRRLCDVLKLGR
ncbi:hypothetical protein N184_35860 [Sinorhizobium sp. GL28]|nr:hypothetical protein N184_35860 [Sinorhizobium sp. GL28]